LEHGPGTKERDFASARLGLLKGKTLQTDSKRKAGRGITMPSEEASVTIDASPEEVFAVLVKDRTDFSKNDEVRWREQVGDEEMGVGYRYRSTFLHRRHHCVMNLMVTAYEPGKLIADRYTHRCDLTKVNVEGTLRYELIPFGEKTTVVATARRRIPGLMGWYMALFGCKTLKYTLEVFASRVELASKGALQETA
jgi:uncharacterized protein YndB with AHSA1/START domain